MSDESITAVILAAGEGRRLEPLTNRRPKPMVPVANKPLLEYVVEAIAEAGISRIILVVGYRQERIRNYFGDGDGWEIDIEYVEQKRQLGTGHAVLQSKPAVDDCFIVLNGDRIVDPSLVSRIQDATLSDETPVMSVTPSDHPRDYGVIAFDDDRVAGIEEKPEGSIESSQINAGVYGFDQSIFEDIEATTPSGELALTATLDTIAREEPISTVSYRGRWLDVSNLWDLLEVNASLVDERAVGSLDSEEHGSIADDVVLDEDIRIGPNATVGGSTSIGDNVSIGPNAVISNSVVFPDAVIESGAVIHDAIVAGNARVGANTTIVGGETTVVVGDQVHEGVEFGGVVGDNAIVNGGTTVAAGTVIGDDVTVDAGATVSGRIEPGVVVRRG